MPSITGISIGIGIEINIQYPTRKSNVQFSPALHLHPWAGFAIREHHKAKATGFLSSKFKVPSSKLSQTVLNNRGGNPRNN